MKAFAFRLQRVLDYRELEEQWARENYLEKRAGRLEAESELLELDRRRRELLTVQPQSLDERLDIELLLNKYDDDERAKRALISVLENEEDIARAEWTNRRQAKEALLKLREAERSEYRRAADRKEQNALDEWAVMRRVA